MTFDGLALVVSPTSIKKKNNNPQNTSTKASHPIREHNLPARAIRLHARLHLASRHVIPFVFSFSSSLF